MAQLVQETYAQALFEAAIECDALEVIKNDFSEVVQLFQSEHDFFELYKTPRIPNDEKKKIIDEAFAKNVCTEVVNFLKVLIDKRRTLYVVKIFDAFENMYRKHHKIERAIVTSVQALNEEQIKLLTQKLEVMTGSTIEIQNILDPNLVGGMMIKIGDRVMDGSVKRRLADMKEALAQLVV